MLAFALPGAGTAAAIGTPSRGAWSQSTVDAAARRSHGHAAAATTSAPPDWCAGTASWAVAEGRLSRMTRAGSPAAR